MSNNNNNSTCISKNIILLGNSGVGKTSLVNKFVNGSFTNIHQATIRVNYFVKEVILHSKSVNMHIYDVAGQELFNGTEKPFYRDADCCVLVFDISDNKSFENLYRWRDEFLFKAAPNDLKNLNFVVLGNKCDKHYRQVSRRRGKQWCVQFGKIPYFEVSAKDNKNVEAAFHQIAKSVLKNEPSEEPFFPGTERSNGNIDDVISSTGNLKITENNTISGKRKVADMLYLNESFDNLQVQINTKRPKLAASQQKYNQYKQRVKKAIQRIKKRFQ